MARPGRQFEEAVHRFVKELGDQSAKVQFDHRVEDRDTGTLRQVDAWVEATLKGHYPFKALISCKDWKEPMDIDDVGCLCDQIRSTGANLGIAYSRTGFTAPALLKAQKNSINCCKLYEDQPADIPEMLIFGSYCATPLISIEAAGSWASKPNPKWSDLFAERVSTAAGEVTVLDELSRMFAALQKESLGSARQGIPEARQITWHLKDQESGVDITVRMVCAWKYFRGKHEAFRVNGSYCINNGHFAGSQAGPAIDTQSPHPGPGWEEIGSEFPASALSGAIVFLFNDALQLREMLEVNIANDVLLKAQDVDRKAD